MYNTVLFVMEMDNKMDLKIESQIKVDVDPGFSTQRSNMNVMRKENVSKLYEELNVCRKGETVCVYRGRIPSSCL